MSQYRIYFWAVWFSNSFSNKFLRLYATVWNIIAISQTLFNSNVFNYVNITKIKNKSKQTLRSSLLHINRRWEWGRGKNTICLWILPTPCSRAVGGSKWATTKRHKNLSCCLYIFAFYGPVNNHEIRNTNHKSRWPIGRKLKFCSGWILINIFSSGTDLPIYCSFFLIL